MLDNAAPNDVLVRVLSRILREKFDVQFVPENSQIRCLAHVVNLVVQKLLATLDEADDPAVVDYYLPNKDLPFHYDPADDPNLRDLESEVFPAVDGDDEEEEDVEMMSELAEELAKLSPLKKASDTSNFYEFTNLILASINHHKNLRIAAAASQVQVDCRLDLQGRSEQGFGSEAVDVDGHP